MNLSRAKFRRAMGGLICLVVVHGILFLPGLRAEIVVDDDFEFRWMTGIPFVPGSSIGNYTGWYLVQGEATVSPLASRSGRHSLHLKPGEPVVRAVLATRKMDLELERIWVRFRMKPAPGKAVEPRMALSVFGAKLAFSAAEEDGASNWLREMLAFDATSGEVIPVNLVVGEGGWLELMFEISPDGWRLHNPGGPISDWLGLDPGSPKSINWFGDPAGDMFIDDVRVAIAEAGENDPRAPWERLEEFDSMPVVVSATYGSGSKHVDVTGRVADLLAEGNDFFARPQWLQKDPTPGWNKELKIVYEYQGARHTFRSGEGGKVNVEILKAQTR